MPRSSCSTLSSDVSPGWGSSFQPLSTSAISFFSSLPRAHGYKRGLEWSTGKSNRAQLWDLCICILPIRHLNSLEKVSFDKDILQPHRCVKGYRHRVGLVTWSQTLRADISLSSSQFVLHVSESLLFCHTEEEIQPWPSVPPPDLIPNMFSLQGLKTERRRSTSFISPFYKEKHRCAEKVNQWFIQRTICSSCSATHSAAGAAVKPRDATEEICSNI